MTRLSPKPRNEQTLRRVASVMMVLAGVAALRAVPALAAEVLRLVVPAVALLPLAAAVAVRLLRRRSAVRRALRSLLSVRGLLRSPRRSSVVAGAASDPESSHAFERTCSRGVAYRAGGQRPGFAAEL